MQGKKIYTSGTYDDQGIKHLDKFKHELVYGSHGSVPTQTLQPGLWMKSVENYRNCHEGFYGEKASDEMFSMINAGRTFKPKSSREHITADYLEHRNYAETFKSCCTSCKNGGPCSG